MQLNLFGELPEQYTDVENTRTCVVCDTKKHITKFQISSYKKGDRPTYKYTCTKCSGELSKEREVLRRIHGPPANTCACCGKETQTKLDHCHKTKKFRGWLCDFCNRGIGLLGDNQDGLKMAIKYLEKANGQS